MNEEKPSDLKRGVIAQREHRSGRVTPRDPKKVKLYTRMFDDEEWTLHTRYHTDVDAKKAADALHKRDKGLPKRKYRVNDQPYEP